MGYSALTPTEIVVAVKKIAAAVAARAQAY
jgi:hypothetical protein